MVECFKTPEICIIAAVAEKNQVIGRDNQMPWHIPADLKRFRELTSGYSVIMGRRTFESLGKPLPNRNNVVISRQSFAGCIRADSLFHAIFMGWAVDVSKDKLFIIGGAQVYRRAIESGIANRIYLTLIEGDFTGDSYFPNYSDFKRVVFEQPGESNGYRYRFLELERFS